MTRKEIKRRIKGIKVMMEFHAGNSDKLLDEWKNLEKLLKEIECKQY